MVELHKYSIDDVHTLSPNITVNDHQRVVAEASRLYSISKWQGRLRKLFGVLTRHPDCLLSLKEYSSHVAMGNGHYVGTRAVPLDEIRGSEGRVNDFDAHFHPRKAHNEARWRGVAIAKLKGVVLPPVELIQVGDIYFVRDGHHRISVAQAFGETHIDAEVQVWQPAHAITVEQMSTACARMPQPA
jgi:hypothetical protein